MTLFEITLIFFFKVLFATDDKTPLKGLFFQKHVHEHIWNPTCQRVKNLSKTSQKSVKDFVELLHAICTIMSKDFKMCTFY